MAKTRPTQTPALNKETRDLLVSMMEQEAVRAQADARNALNSGLSVIRALEAELARLQAAAAPKRRTSRSRKLAPVLTRRFLTATRQDRPEPVDPYREFLAAHPEALASEDRPLLRDMSDSQYAGYILRDLRESRKAS